MGKFNLQQFIKKQSAKRIKDRGINWEENYHKKSEAVKKKFEKTVGPDSYKRWEGHDYETNSDYYVVVGPAQTADGRKAFFAGYKKLPDDPDKKVYAPSGKYFYSLVSAFSYAAEHWGVPFPEDSVDYDEDDLKFVDIPRHVKS